MKNIVTTILLCVLLLSCSSPETPLISLSGKTMGTTYSVKYVNSDGATTSLSPKQVQDKIELLLANINQLMSTYIPDSELSMLNKVQAGVSFPISAETEFVLREALKLNRLSQGMLDITIGPIVNLWGFGPTKRPNKIPSQTLLDETLAYVGVNQFTLTNSEVVKHHQNVYIDLSTIAKGYAVDRIADLLMQNSLSNYLVEIGGEMRVAGTKANQEKWIIAIEKPISGERAIQQIISIGDNAIATSGDYRNYYEENGVRYSHLINPKTAYPIQHNLVAVTVVSPTSIAADGLATALIIMGSEQGIKLAESQSIAALFITKVGNEFVEYQTKSFKNQVEVIELTKGN